MNKKADGGITFIIIALIVLAGGGYYLSKNTDVFDKMSLFSALAPPTGGKDAGITEISATAYTCSVGNGGTGDFCDVEGIVKNVDISIGQQTVSFRTNALSTSDYDTSGTWIAINATPSVKDLTPTSTLIGYCYSTTSSGSIPLTLSTTNVRYTPHGNTIVSYNSKIFISITSAKSRIYAPCSSADITPISKEPYTSRGQEMAGGTTPQYKVTWQFCPAGDATFAYCNGANFETTSTNPITASTEKVRLIEGQSIGFNPKDINGQLLPQFKFSIKVQKWDMTCAGDYANKCTSGQYYCVGKICPTGYVIDTIKNDCRKTTYAYEHIPFIYNQYKTCTGIDSNGCAVWSSSTSVCSPSNLKCYSGTSLVEGVGSCKCDPNQCNLNSRRVSELGGDYDLCLIGSSGCNEWQSRTCVSGLTYESATQKCINEPNDPKCVAYTPHSECTGTTQVSSCTSNGITDEKGNQRWYLTSINCVPPKTCVENGNNDLCGCDCALSSKTCKSPTEYTECIGGTQCFQDKTITNPDLICYQNQIKNKQSVPCAEGGSLCETGKTCISGSCVAQGCQYNTAGFQCNTANFETCVNNACVCQQDDNTCSATDVKRCSSNKAEVQKCVKHGNCYRWETDNICTDNNNCRDSTKTCEPYFIAKATFRDYAIGEKIDNITIDVSTDYGNNIGIVVRGELYSGTTNLGVALGTTNTQGKAFLEFPNVKTIKQEDLTLKVYVGSGNLSNIYNFSKTLFIKKTLAVYLTCPVQATIKREISCSFSVKDKETNIPVTLAEQPSITVLAGTTPINYDWVGTDKIKFTTEYTGSLSVRIDVEKDTYMPDSQVAIINVQPLVTSYDFFIDDKNYYTYVSGLLDNGYLIDTGIHTFKFIVMESSIPIDVLRVEASIKTPSGQTVPLTFTQQSTGVFTSSYNFVQPGYTYNLKGIIYFKDVTKDNVPVSMAINTKGTTGIAGTTGDVATTSSEKFTSYFIIGGSILAGLIIIGFLMRKK